MAACTASSNPHPPFGHLLPGGEGTASAAAAASGRQLPANCRRCALEPLSLGERGWGEGPVLKLNSWPRAPRVRTLIRPSGTFSQGEKGQSRLQRLLRGRHLPLAPGLQLSRIRWAEHHQNRHGQRPTARQSTNQGRSRKQKGPMGAFRVGIAARRSGDEQRLHLLHRAGFDLADAFGRDAVLGGQVLQGDLAVVVQPATLDDVARARVQLGQAFAQHV